MTKRKKRVDWSKVQEQFDCQRSDEPDLTLAEFCRQKKLKYETARKRINTQPMPEQLQPTPLPQSPPSGDHSQSPLLTGKTASGETVNMRSFHDPESGRFTKGNQAARVHGGYSKYFDKGIVELVNGADLTANGDELTLVRYKLHQVAAYEQNMKMEIMDLYASGGAKLDSKGQALTLFEALSDIELRLREVNKDLINAYTKLQASYRVHSRAEMAAHQAEIINRGRAADKGAADIARELEANGVPVPALLMFEARKEVMSYEPPADDSGMSDDELDALTAKYMEEQRKSILNDLPARRESVAELLDMIGEDGQEADEVESDEQSEATSNFGEFDDLADFKELESA